MQPQEEKKFDEWLKGLEPEQPSMRFTKNVMEAVDAHTVAPAAKKYVNPALIRGLFLFFIVMLVAITGYTLSQANWSGGDNASQPFIPKMPAGALKYILSANVILLLLLADRLLNRHRPKEEL